MARPRSIFPDEPTLWDLAYLGCTNREIAQAVGCHPSLLSKRPDLAAILDFARDDRAAAIARLWLTHPAGDLRPAGRPEGLVELVRVADRRSIQRRKSLAPKCAEPLTASREESSQRRAISDQESLTADELTADSYPDGQ